MALLGKEDEYFLAQEVEQRARLRARLEAAAQEAADRQQLVEQIGVDDEHLIERIRALGFDGQTAQALYLIPLIEVAWADGKLASEERSLILQAAETHGIKPGMPAATMLATLLESRPSDTVLEQLLEVLKDLLQSKNMHPTSVIEACIDVAAASGGFLGFGDRISKEERSLIEQIASGFGEDARKLIRSRLS